MPHDIMLSRWLRELAGREEKSQLRNRQSIGFRVVSNCSPILLFYSKSLNSSGNHRPLSGQNYLFQNTYLFLSKAFINLLWKLRNHSQLSSTINMSRKRLPHWNLQLILSIWQTGWFFHFISDTEICRLTGIGQAFHWIQFSSSPLNQFSNIQIVFHLG